jgi:hypothetical protein
MIKIDKTYTIKYSKSGVCQYSDFRYSNGKLVSSNFSPSWVSEEDVPSLEGLNDIEDILKVIKDFSFANRAEIYLINNEPVYFYENETAKKSLKSINEKYEKFMEQISYDFFAENIKPILTKKGFKISTSWCGMPVLIKKDEEGEWQNIEREEKEIDYLCYNFLYEVGLSDESINLKTETGYYSFKGFSNFFKFIPNEKIKDLIIEL